MAVDIKEYSEFTGITEEYATEILKDKDHAIWHMPAGLSKNEKRQELIDTIIEDYKDNQLVLANALIESFSVGGDVSLNQDIEFYESFASVEGNVTLDLNGKTLSFKSRPNKYGEPTAYGLVVKDGAKLVINGDGALICDAGNENGNVIWAYGGDVEINGGKFENLSACLECIYASKNSEIIINDGEFKAAFNDGSVDAAKNDYNILNKLDADRDKCSIKVRGGRFYRFDPANNLSEGPGTNFVDEGYESIKEGDWYIVRKK